MVIETCPVLVKYLLPVRLSRLHRGRRCAFCLRNSFAIVRRTSAYHGKEKNNRKSPAAFCKHCPGAQRFRLKFSQQPAKPVRGLHGDTCSEKKFCCPQPTA
jgi:hypothetical protein